MTDRRCEERGWGSGGWMTQSFVSVNPIERRSAQTKEFVLIRDGGHLIIAVLEFSSSEGN